MNIDTCVPLQPFGTLCNGGKLIASIAFSKEIQEIHKKRYKHPLLGLTTTGLYGKTVMYDRIPQFKFVGYTAGHSTHQMSTEVNELCREYLKTKNIHYDSRQKFYAIQRAFTMLNLPKETYLQGIEKGIYFGFVGTYYKSNDQGDGKVPKPIYERRLSQQSIRDFLSGKTDTPPEFMENQQTVAEIGDWWIHRWAIKRFESQTRKPSDGLDMDSVQ